LKFDTRAARYTGALLNFFRRPCGRKIFCTVLLARHVGGRFREASGDVPKRTCRAEHPLCIEMFADAGERQQCAAAVDVMRRLLGGPAPQLTLEGLRQALGAEQ
jgi:hypothetical protein